MAVVVPELGIVLTAPPGAASTSLRHAALAVPGAVAVDPKHATVAALRTGGAEVDPRLRVVTSTRNPFDWYVAEWHRTRTRWVEELRDPSSFVHTVDGFYDRIADAVGHDFPAWLRIALTDPAPRPLFAAHVTEAHVVLRVEHLAADLAAAGLDALSVPHANRGRDRPPYWQHYDRASRAAVEAAHAPDLTRFGYRF